MRSSHQPRARSALDRRGRPQDLLAVGFGMACRRGRGGVDLAVLTAPALDNYAQPRTGRHCRGVPLNRDYSWFKIPAGRFGVLRGEWRRPIPGVSVLARPVTAVVVRSVARCRHALNLRPGMANEHRRQGHKSYRGRHS